MFFTDINECLDASLYDCDVNAVCVNTIGNYTCQCVEGYTGDGAVCDGKFMVNIPKITVRLKEVRHQHLLQVC